MSSTNSDIDKYGPTMKEYLNEEGYNRPRELAPSLTEADIADAVKSLAEPARVTFRTFETLMALEWSPLCNHMELILGDSRVYPLCIKLLQIVYAGGRDILGNAYGFMCLQFITLAMEVAKLAQNDRLFAFKEEISELSPGRSIRCFLNNHARELEGEIIWCDTGKVNKYAQYMGWDWGEDDYGSCLPQIGGCGFKDTVFLLEKLWIERQLFLEAAQVASGIFPGWGGLLNFMWHAVRGNLGELDGPSVLATKRLSELCWKYVFELGLRYAMCSEMREDPLVYVTVTNHNLRNSLRASDNYDPVNDEDAILVATCTTRKLRTLSNINNMNLMAGNIFGYALFLLSPTDIEFHVKQLYEAFIYRAWSEISAVHRMDGFRWFTFGAHLNDCMIALNLFLEKHRKRPDCAIAVRNLALEWDLYELHAYILLFPLSLVGKSINATASLPDCLEFENALQLKILRHRLLDSGVSPDSTFDFFPLWEKINSHILFHQEILGDGRKSDGRDMATLWKEATRIFPYEHYVLTNPAFQCAYVRCAAPKVIVPWECERCFLKIYCSHRCQQADWAYHSNSHVLQCRTTKKSGNGW